MTWTYSQSTGELTQDGRHVATGYSGAGDGRNNPGQQATRNVGPIPQGRYTIGAPHNSRHVGPEAMSLTPLPGTQTFGRSDFLIHGDSRTHPGAASAGCIVLPLDIRRRIAGSGDTNLEVTR
jgi:hypothetical protein